MRVLVACEFSGVVRDAFLAQGHDAWSCDLTDTEVPGPHIQGDVLQALEQEWDLMVAHPPCTVLAISGSRWFPEATDWVNLSHDSRAYKQLQAVEFVKTLAAADIPRIAIENPVSILSSAWRKPDQTFQPWQFGHGEKKRTCLWLKNLPLLHPTVVVEGRSDRIHMMPPSADRGRKRSITYPGVAEAMAEQWSTPSVTGMYDYLERMSR